MKYEKQRMPNLPVFVDGNKKIKNDPVRIIRSNDLLFLLIALSSNSSMKILLNVDHFMRKQLPKRV